MKLLLERPPFAKLRHSMSPVRHAAKPLPQPELGWTVESPTSAMRIFARWVAGCVEGAARAATANVRHKAKLSLIAPPRSWFWRNVLHRAQRYRPKQARINQRPA